MNCTCNCEDFHSQTALTLYCSRHPQDVFSLCVNKSQKLDSEGIIIKKIYVQAQQSSLRKITSRFIHKEVHTAAAATQKKNKTFCCFQDQFTTTAAAKKKESIRKTLWEIFLCSLSNVRHACEPLTIYQTKKKLE